MELKFQLRDILIENFNIGEIKSLSFDLDIDYENLSGSNKNSKILSLIGYAQRRGRLEDLARYVKSARPNADFGDVEVEPNRDNSVERREESQTIVQYNFQGDIIGSTFGERSIINAENIIGTKNDNSPAAISDSSVFIQQLEKLQSLLKRAVINQDFSDFRDSKTVVEDVNDIIDEAKNTNPRSNRISRRLEDIQDVLGENIKSIDESKKDENPLLEALPIVTNLLKVVHSVYG